MSSDTIALEKSDQKKFSRATKRLKDQLETGVVKLREKKSKVSEESRGLVYLGHLPHGFYEDEMKEYFSQFGKVINVLVCRSAKTGNSKGYGYVEFEHQDVAKIAAETMDNYVMFKKRVVTEYIPPEKRPRNIFHGKKKVPGKPLIELKRQRQRIQRNKKVSEAKHIKKSKQTLKKLGSKMEKLRSKGINYDLKPVNVPDTLKVKLKKKDV